MKLLLENFDTDRDPIQREVEVEEPVTLTGGSLRSDGAEIAYVCARVGMEFWCWLSDASLWTDISFGDRGKFEDIR